ncbi:MAG: haloacid dehalogenase [Cereibacter sphaeroides]|uniref:Haloacid dehalogenase n=1 Tax=Cereibacter sphaeroides TaxID=1063 RepID=A0A2W5URA7_CERSP|nr:MAG: haloacid dehalogenase [Cereibacter sphaeroides]
MFIRKAFFAALVLLAGPALAQDTVLPSWNEGAARDAVVNFVTAATTEGNAGWIAPADRIAVFDNDGTLWSEQPLYFQGLFAMDRIKEMAPDHPEWKVDQPFKGALEGDLAAVAASGEAGIEKILGVTHANMTAEAFKNIVKNWIATARHPKFNRPYTDLTFQPMKEMLDYLRANGFQTWIVSGGGIDFMRPWAEASYGIPPQQVIGSQIAETYEVVDGKPVIMRNPEIFFIDDGAGKPIGINRHIGKRPVIAFGNSDGDFEMLQYTTSGEGPRLGMIVHHTDAVREFAYDRDSHVGKLDKALDAAPKEGWVLIDMAKDWSRVYSFEQ